MTLLLGPSSRIEIRDAVANNKDGDALRKKKRSRTAHKASATRMVGQIETIITGEDPDLARLTLLQLTLKETRDHQEPRYRDELS